MSDPIQYELDRIYKFLKAEHPEYGYSQIEARLHAYLSSQMSKFRHRVNNPDQYTGMKYDPEGKLKDDNVIDINDYSNTEPKFFSSRIPNC